MAKQSAKGILAQKYGDRLNKAVEAHKDDEIKLPGGGRLPAGIENGIAQLVDIRIGLYENGALKGQPFWMASGIVVEPKEHEGLPVAGARTSIMEPLCDTPQRQSRPTFEDHVGWVMNEMRKLGAETTEMGGEDLEAVGEALKEAAPFFSFRTWKSEATPQYPNPQTQETWVRACEYEGGADADDGVVEQAPPKATAPAPAKTATKAAPATPKAAVKPTPAPEPEPEAEADLDALAEAADGGDVDAQTTINELAKAQGIDSDAYGTWAEVVELLAAGGDGGEGNDGEATDGAAEPPKVGDVYYYKPKDKTGKPAAKSVEAEVTHLFEPKETCNLRNLSDKTLYRGVPWGELLDSP